MSDPDSLVQRLDQLEAQVAYQDRTIEDLNQAIVDQWRQIEVLTRQVQRLSEEVKRAGEMIAPAGDEPPPPHY